MTRATDPEDKWSWLEPTSPAELAADRDAAIASIRKHYPDLKVIKFTCETCARAPLCTLAYDEMNLDGDCLMDK